MNSRRKIWQKINSVRFNFQLIILIMDIRNNNISIVTLSHCPRMPYEIFDNHYGQKESSKVRHSLSDEFRYLLILDLITDAPRKNRSSATTTYFRKKTQRNQKSQKEQKKFPTQARIFIINNLNQTSDFATWIEKTISCFF